MKNFLKRNIICIVFIIIDIRLVIISQNNIKTALAVISGIIFTCILINNIKQSKIESNNSNL